MLSCYEYDSLGASFIGMELPPLIVFLQMHHVMKLLSVPTEAFYEMRYAALLSVVALWCSHLRCQVSSAARSSTLPHQMHPP